MRTKEIFILIAVFALKNRAEGTELSIPNYWKLIMLYSSAIGNDAAHAKLINENGKNYCDFGNRREPMTLEPVGNDGKIDEKINKYFNAKIRIGRNFKPDLSSQKQTGNVITVISYLENTNGPYDDYVYSPVNHRDDIPINWELDPTKPAEFRIEDKIVSILFSVRRIKSSINTRNL